MLLDSATLELFITNVGYTISAVLSLGLGIFVLFKSPRKAEHVIFFLLSLAGTTFMLSHAIGINLADPEASRLAFMFNLAVPFIFAFNAHLVFAVTGKVKKETSALAIIYVLAVFLIALFLIRPDWYLHPSTPFLYFPNYYLPGRFYFLQTVYQLPVLFYFLYRLVQAYARSDHAERNRLWYFVIAFMFGYSVALLPILPVYRINFDPILSVLVGLWTIPIAYGIVRQNLMDIRVVARRALVYLSLVIASTAGLATVNIANIWLLGRYPNLPIWVIPAFSSLLGIGIGIFIWFKAKESDVLKYEFVKIVTHKFRTPLTHIKLSLDELRAAKLDTRADDSIERIEIANNHLMELTNVLMETAKAEGAAEFYQFKSLQVNELLSPILSAYRKEMDSKQLNLVRELDSNLPPISADRDRMESVFQILLENAIEYSLPGQTITARTERNGGHVLFSIRDEGIGISQSELPFMFSQFFRTKQAVSTDTEGIGLGLFIAKNIVEQHGGTIYAKSPGKNLGSTFYVKLPTDRHMEKK